MSHCMETENDMIGGISKFSASDYPPLRIVVNEGQDDEREISLDFMAVKVAIEAVEMKHETFREGWVSSPGFIADLAAAVRSAGLPECSGMLAWQIWHMVAEVWGALKKNTPIARLLQTATESIPTNSPASSASDCSPTLDDSMPDEKSQAATPTA